MNLDKVIAVRNTKTIYRDGDKCIKLFNEDYSKADVLNVRKGASTSFERISFQNLSADAQKKVLRLAGYKANGYVRGLEFTVFETAGSWGRTPSGWVCLDYCERV